MRIYISEEQINDTAGQRFIVFLFFDKRSDVIAIATELCLAATSKNLKHRFYRCFVHIYIYT